MWGTTGRLAAAVMLVIQIGCGSDGGGASDAGLPDALAPDATSCDLTVCGEECVDTRTSTDHCGECFNACTPSQDCDQTCQCPTVAIVAGDFILGQMDTDMLAPTILGIGLYGDGDPLNALVIGFRDPDTPTATDIALSGDAEAPFVAIGYDVDTLTREFRGAFRAQSGTLSLTRRCAAGVAGSVTNAALVEVDPEADPPEPLADGCTAAIEAIDFDFGDPCE